LFAAGGKYKPGSWDSRYAFSMVDGKLLVEYEEMKRYDVDPDTLKRTPTKDKLPFSPRRKSTRNDRGEAERPSSFERCRLPRVWSRSCVRFPDCHPVIHGFFRQTLSPVPK
jgi:hypothetical protein